MPGLASSTEAIMGNVDSARPAFAENSSMVGSASSTRSTRTGILSPSAKRSDGSTDSDGAVSDMYVSRTRPLTVGPTRTKRADGRSPSRWSTLSTVAMSESPGDTAEASMTAAAMCSARSDRLALPVKSSTSRTRTACRVAKPNEGGTVVCRTSLVRCLLLGWPIDSSALPRRLVSSNMPVVAKPPSFSSPSHGNAITMPLLGKTRTTGTSSKKAFGRTGPKSCGTRLMRCGRADTANSFVTGSHPTTRTTTSRPGSSPSGVTSSVGTSTPTVRSAYSCAFTCAMAATSCGTDRSVVMVMSTEPLKSIR
mmetsp:Transcript_5416/g.17508  ORF Transcript_5416/g.17508 Transcript_5416/m.17508 type:complete len:309 (+) Transcript_5416:1189-2115(+)